MSALLSIIRDLIEKRGPLSLADYMELALQHPEFGYYRRGNPLGRKGDFVTAPDISQMFGEMIGLWCADVWRQMGKPEEFILLELGPGQGTLMQDALRATAKIAGFQSAMKLYLMESNETLRTVQQKKLADYQIQYIENLDEVPKLPLLVIANEFFDALPIRQFEKTFHGWCEKRVGMENGDLVFVLSESDPALHILIPKDMQEALPGTVYEVSLPSMGLMKNLARRLVTQKGTALIIDYGYVEPSGKPSFQAMSEHQFADVLSRPGEIDLTAHVDFGALKNVALVQGASVLGPLGQGEFLKALGIELRAMQLRQAAAPKQVDDINVALHRLTDSSQMGALFKAMAVASPELLSLPGF